MKRIAFLILSVLLTVSVFAQDPGATEKNAGNAAVKAKNYPEAFKQYEAYLKIVNNKDNATVQAAVRTNKRAASILAFKSAN